MEGVVKRFVQGAEKRNLTLDQYLDLLLNLHDLYDKAAESELDAIKNDVGQSNNRDKV